MRVSSIQFKIQDYETKEQRLNHMSSMLDSCKGSQLIVMPEMWNMGFYNFNKYESESETINGQTVSLLSYRARELGAYIMGGSFVEKDQGRLFNTSVFLNPKGEIIAKFRKIHLTGIDSKEDKLLTPGSEVVTVSTELGDFGFATCYDLRFPELFRKMLDKGVDFFIVPSAWAFPRLDHWRILCQARAIENVCYLISCNCVGMDNGKQYFGHSSIINPWGVVIAGAGFEEAIITTEVDSAEVKRIREIFPPVRDRVELI